MSNLGLENFLLSNLNINLKRSSVGDINVIQEMQQYDSILGGEQSGHIIISEFSKSANSLYNNASLSKPAASPIGLPKSSPQQR